MDCTLPNCSRRENDFSKRYSIAEVFRQLYLSDDDCFDHDDSNRDSDEELDDVDCVSDVDSEATEDYNAQTADDLDSETGHVDWLRYV